MTRRVLHIIRSEHRRALCRPAPGDRIVALADTDPDELVTLIFSFDVVIVW